MKAVNCRLLARKPAFPQLFPFMSPSFFAISALTRITRPEKIVIHNIPFWGAGWLTNPWGHPSLLGSVWDLFC